MRGLRLMWWMAVVAVCAWPSGVAQAEIAMKVLIVNPSKTEVREFNIHSPLPPEIKPEHVLDADGLKVEFDSQSGVYFLVGTVTLKPKEAVTRKVVLEDVWAIPTERITSLRREVREITTKLSGSPYEDQGRLMANAIQGHLATIETSQEQPFLNPQQHISQYHEHMKTLQMVESDLISLRQLMVMATLKPSTNQPVVVNVEAASGAGHERSGLSVLATWRLIFVVLALLGFVSLSFFLVWQRQLKTQLAKQAAHEHAQAALDLTHAANGNGTRSTRPETVSPPAILRVQPKTPL